VLRTPLLGAIYALERIMIDFSIDHTTIVEVLAAFVRLRVAEDVVHDRRAARLWTCGQRRDTAKSHPRRLK
jgi:hypothetical protein